MLRSLLLSTALLLPVAAAAEAPPPVTEIHAERTADGVRVTWAPVPGPIARYQVYYNSESILKSGGSYEDFDLTEDATTSHIVSGPITAGPVYVSVIAESLSGEDSGFFVEEATVPAPGNGTPQLLDEPEATASSQANMVLEEPTGEDIPVVTQEPAEELPVEDASSSEEAAVATSSELTEDAPTSDVENPVEEEVMPTEEPAEEVLPTEEPVDMPIEEPAEDPALLALREAMRSPFRMYAVYAPSPTLVRMFFSHDVALNAEEGGGALLLEDDAGRSIPLKRFVIEGSMMTAETASPLKAGMRYSLLVGPAVRGIDPDDRGMLHDIHPLVRAAYFLGASVPKAGSNEVPRIALNAMPDGDDTYVIQAAWEFPVKRDDISGFVIAQSTDDGKTETGEHTVPFGVNAISYNAIPDGGLTLRVRTLSMKGTPSGGLASSITLLPLHSEEPTIPERPNTPAAPLAGSITAPATPAVPSSSGLSHSGAALGLALACSGAVAGIVRMRRRRALAVVAA